MTIELLTQFREFFEERKIPGAGLDGESLLSIAQAKETLFSLGSRFRISPEEYDSFFALFKPHNLSLPGLIGEQEFVDLVAEHEN
jgi:hypothetical protein